MTPSTQAGHHGAEPRTQHARRSTAPRAVGERPLDLRALILEYGRISQTWVARLRSLLDEHERIDAEQRSALLAVVGSSEAGRPHRRLSGDLPGDLKSLVDAYERTLILSALANTGGVQKRAATALGVRCTTLNEKMKRLGIELSRSSS